MIVVRVSSETTGSRWFITTMSAGEATDILRRDNPGCEVEVESARDCIDAQYSGLAELTC